jgi:NAD(P) transhydrogenase
MSTIGLTESQATEKFGGALVGKADFSEVTRGHINRIQNGLLKLIAAPDGRKLLGVQIVGEGATELIHIGQMGLIANNDIDIFIETIFNFPTLAEAYRVAALQIKFQRKSSDS